MSRLSSFLRIRLFSGLLAGALVASSACAPVGETSISSSGIEVAGAAAGPGATAQPRAGVEPDAPVGTQRQVAPTASPTATPERLAQVRAAIEPSLAAFGGSLALVIEEVGSGARIEHQAEVPFASASVYKLAVAMEVLRQVDDGSLGLDEPLTIQEIDALEADAGDLEPGDMVTVREALEAMLGHSSNSAAFALMRIAGRPRINALAVAMGLGHTSVPLLVGDEPLPGSEPHDDGWAVTTAADMARLARAVAKGEGLSAESLEVLRRLLSMEEEVDPLRQALPEEVPVLAKTGNLASVSNIVGVIETSGGPVVVSVLTDGVNVERAREMIGQIGVEIDAAYGGGEAVPVAAGSD